MWVGYGNDGALTCGQRNVDSLLETAAQGLVDVPRKVGGGQHHDDLSRSSRQTSCVCRPSGLAKKRNKRSFDQCRSWLPVEQCGRSIRISRKKKQWTLRRIAYYDQVQYLAGVLALRADAVHLDEQLRLDASRRLVLRLGAAARAQRVDLVDEDGRRRVEARHFEQQPHLWSAKRKLGKTR